MVESALYGLEIWWEGRKKRIEERFTVFFKKCARAITGYLKGSEGNMGILEANIRTVQSILDKRNRRFRV